MASKMVTDRQKKATALGAVLDHHAREATETFIREMETELRGDEQVPDLHLFQELLLRRLQRNAQALVEADEQHRQEKKDDVTHRKTRDSAVEELTPILTRLSKAVEMACGAGSCNELLDLDKVIPRDPVVLHRHVERVLRKLRNQGFEAPGTTLVGFHISGEEWIPLLEEPNRRLGEALFHLSRESRQTVDTQRQKNAAFKRYDRTYLASARILESFFRYIDLDDLAEKVRPRRRSSGSSRRPAPAPEAPSPEPSGGPVSARLGPDLKPGRGQDRDPTRFHPLLPAGPFPATEEDDEGFPAAPV